jgi:hypothetical protein
MERFRIGFADRKWYWEPFNSENKKPEENVCVIASSLQGAMLT